MNYKDNLHLLRVFTDVSGNHGDLASVVIDEGRHISDDIRQAMAKKLNTVETAFVNNTTATDISIMHSQGEIGFAGGAVLATSYMLSKLHSKPVSHVHSREGDIATWQENDITWARASLTIMPAWSYEQRETPAEIETMKREDMAATKHIMFWAWFDEVKGVIRARTFATDWDIPEAESNGSGALLLATKLHRPIEMRHGKGSVMFAKPASNNYGDIGGRVKEVVR